MRCGYAGRRHAPRRVTEAAMGALRSVEMYCCYADHTWREGTFVEIPADTPADEIERAAILVAEERYRDESIAIIGVYHIPAEDSVQESGDERT
jgi:hypothetical protein